MSFTKNLYLQEPGEERSELLGVGLYWVWNGTQPALCERGQSQNARLQVNHPAAGHGCRRRYCQILHLKHDCHHLATRMQRSIYEHQHWCTCICKSN